MDGNFTSFINNGQLERKRITSAVNMLDYNFPNKDKKWESPMYSKHNKNELTRRMSVQGEECVNFHSIY